MTPQRALMKFRKGREVAYCTPETWARQHGFEPPAKWLDAINRQGTRDVGRKEWYTTERNEFPNRQQHKLTWPETPGDCRTVGAAVVHAAAVFLRPIWDAEVFDAFGGFVPMPKIIVGRGRRRAGWFDVRAWQIGLTAGDATKGTVLHEAAHALTPQDRHGPEFQRVVRHLYGRYLLATTTP